jgi:hypothetical protein
MIAEGRLSRNPSTFSSFLIKEPTMSAPSRRPEIRRRRTRKEKIQKLRKQLTAAGAEADRSRISGKLAKLARKSPGEPIVRP